VQATSAGKLRSERKRTELDNDLITCGHPHLAGRPLACHPVYSYLVLSFCPIGALEDNDTSRSERYFLYSEITLSRARSDYRWAPKSCQPTNISGLFAASHNSTQASCSLTFGSSCAVRRGRFRAIVARSDGGAQACVALVLRQDYRYPGYLNSPPRSHDRHGGIRRQRACRRGRDPSPKREAELREEACRARRGMQRAGRQAIRIPGGQRACARPLPPSDAPASAVKLQPGQRPISAPIEGPSPAGPEAPSKLTQLRQS
jgi:hypothetical protein